MNDSAQSVLYKFRRNAFIVALSWTIIITLFFVYSRYQQLSSLKKQARAEALSNYKKDVAYRHWATMHGGVYVPITDSTPPNPYLAHVPERDITTPSGKQLTLINPAYMLRQIIENYEVEYGIKGHITSLDPIRPENAPDEWETKALLSFEEGQEEFLDFINMKGEPYIRYMRPIMVTEGCLKCHAQQGYIEGDVRGGISVSIPLTQEYQESRKNIGVMGIGFSFTWLLGLIGIFFITHRLIRNEKYRIKVEEELRNLANQYQDLYENAPDMYISVDADSAKVVNCNQALLEKLGYEREEVVGHPVFKLYHESSLEKAKEAFQQFIQTGEVKNLEMIVEGKNGRQMDVSLNVSSIKDDYGNILQSRSIWRDITEKKKLVDELMIAKHQAEESDRLKSVFLANMSHEIRTPMNSIIGFAEILKEEQLTKEESDRFINIIINSSDRMLNTINDLIDISRIEAGEIELNLSEIDLLKQFEAMFAMFGSSANRKGLELRFENPYPDQTIRFITDSLKFNAIVTNLINNAIKYTDTGYVEFGYRLENQNIQIYVKDSGIGISEDRQQAIFDRFVQADLNYASAHEGSGLGLSIAKAYVEILEGSIRLESKLGKGTCFYVYLPALNKPITSEPKSSSTDLPVPVDLSSLTILVAEDEEASRAYLESAIGSYCKSLIITEDGEEAVETFRENPAIDIILMDIKMPRMDGLTATQLIREMDANVIIIAQTAYALEGDQEKALAAGCNDYLSKPIRLKELLEILGRHA